MKIWGEKQIITAHISIDMSVIPEYYKLHSDCEHPMYVKNLYYYLGHTFLKDAFGKKQ